MLPLLPVVGAGDATPGLQELPALQRLRCLITAGAMSGGEIQMLADQLLYLSRLRFLEIKYSAMRQRAFIAVLVAARQLELVSIVEYRNNRTHEKCKRFESWLKAGAFRNKQYTMLEPPTSKDLRGRREWALEYSHYDKGYAFVKPKGFWKRCTLKERFNIFKDCWDKDIVSTNEYANMW